MTPGRVTRTLWGVAAARVILVSDTHLSGSAPQDIGDNPWPGAPAGSAVDATRHQRWLDIS
jgi:hypothetical protein